MGGFTIQHYLAAGCHARAAILVSPVPAHGAWGATFKVILSHPGKFLKANLTLDVGAVVETEEAAYNFLVSDRLPPEFVEPYMSGLERASYRAYLDLLFNRPRPKAVETPVLVVGGRDDDFFTEAEWAKTARLWDGQLGMLEGIGHQPMWEGEGTALVRSIDDFVSGLSDG